MYCGHLDVCCADRGLTKARSNATSSQSLICWQLQRRYTTIADLSKLRWFDAPHIEKSMTRLLFASLLLLSSFSALAQETEEVDPTVIEFSEAMGVQNLISATLEQTRVSLKASMTDLSGNLRQKYPDLSQEQNQFLDELLDRYVDTILNSIDAEKAAVIYAKVIAEGLSESEVNQATEYYTSPEGQNLLRVIGVASSELNQYLLDQMTGSARTAQVKLNQDLAEFTRQASADPSSPAQ